MVILLLCFSHYGNAIHIYEPYEDLVARAELIVTGTIIEKQFNESETDVFTVYKLKIKQIIKGKSNSVEINIKASGGCYKKGICITAGTGYDFEAGDQVFMMLKQSNENKYFNSVRAGSTVSFVSDDGILYSSDDEFTYNFNRIKKRSAGETAATIDEVKSIVRLQNK